MSKIATTKIQFQQKLHDFCALFCARGSLASPHGSAGAAERPGAGRRLCTGMRSAHQAIPAKVARLLRSRNCANKKAIPAKVARLLRVFLRSRQFGFASRLRGGGRKAGRRSAPLHGHAISTTSNSSKSCTTFALAELRQQKSNSSKSCTTFARFFALAAVWLRLTAPRGRPKGRAPVGAFARACDQHTKQFQQKLHDFCVFFCARASSASPHGSAGAAERPGAGRRLCTGMRSAHQAIPAKVARLLRVFLRSRQFGFASRLRGGGRKAGRRSAPLHGHAISTPSNSSKSCTTFARFFALAAVWLRLTAPRGRPKGRAPVGAFARACDQHTKQFQQKLHDFCARGIAPTKIQFQQKLHDFCVFFCARASSASPHGSAGAAERPGAGRRLCTGMRSAQQAIPAKVVDFCASEIAPKNKFTG